MTEEDQYRHWVDKVREYRESTLYPKLFGERHGDPAELSAAHLGRIGERNGCPKHWLSYGVLTFEPSPTRASWL